MTTTSAPSTSLPCSTFAPAREYTVLVSAAKMPAKCWGRYVHVAVMAHLPCRAPSRIDTRPWYVTDLVEYHGRQHMGRTRRSAGSRAIIACEVTAARLRAAAQRSCDYRASSASCA